MPNPNHDRFHFEVNSFAEFVQFVALIRGEQFDIKKIMALTENINKTNSELKAAVDSQTKTEK